MSDEFRFSREATPIQSALKSAVGGVMRQIRRYSAMSVTLDVLPKELAGQVAPYDVRLAPPVESREPAVLDASSETGKPRPQLALAEVNTLYLYVASGTVQLALEQLKPKLIQEINEHLPYPFIEEIRFEQAGMPKITRQLNILGTSPD